MRNSRVANSRPRANSTFGIDTDVANSRPRANSTFGMDITNTRGHVTSIKDSQATKGEAPFSRPNFEQPKLEVVEPRSVEQPRFEIRIAEALDVSPQECSDYEQDINEKFFQDEVALMPAANYMDEQVDLTPKMRTILLDWLSEVHLKYKLRQETFHLTVNLADRYLSKVQVTRRRLQLVGVVAMFIASKFEEIHPPELHDWVYITDKAYTKQDVLNAEVSMLNVLNFRIVVPTAAHFLPFLQKANGCDARQCELVQYILELGLLDIRTLQYTSSQTVSAALLLSNQLLRRRSSWPSLMESKSHHSESSLRPCVAFLREVLDNDQAGGEGQLRAVYKKFSRRERHSVATSRF